MGLTACGPLDGDGTAGRRAGVRPAEGSVAGGTEVMVYGSGFRADARVAFGSLLAAETEWIDATALRAVTPLADPGCVDVHVLHGPAVHLTLPEAFTFTGRPALALHSVVPAEGPPQGGTLVTVHGRGFGEDALVLFGDQAATETTFVNGLVLQVVTPATSVGLVDLRVLRGEGEQAVLADAFTFVGRPLSVNGVSPTSGSASGGARVRVTGGGFTPRTEVRFGGRAALSVTYLGPEQLMAVAPAAPAGVVDVTVWDPERAQAVLASGFTVEPGGALVLEGIHPSGGLVEGGGEVALSGVGFGEGIRVFFGAQEASAVLVQDPTRAVAVAPPAAAPGQVGVAIVGAGGRRAELPGAFTYAAPSVGGVGEPGEHPWVAGAVSLGPDLLRVDFSAPMGSEVRDGWRYTVVGHDNDASHLVLSAQAHAAGADNRWVELRTGKQSEMRYTVAVYGVRDRTGRAIAATYRRADATIRYNEADFMGQAETGIPLDEDGDGIGDADEQRGWLVRVVASDGSVSELAVSSDLAMDDTDGDEVGDGDELANGTNPRSPDTDADTVSDFDELNRFLSDPCSQDSDGDGLNDPTERYFGTSLALADTDGDQFDDFQEVVQMQRNPRIADLPEPEIVTGTIDLRIDQRYTYTDLRDEEHSEQASFETSLLRGEESAFSTASSTTVSAMWEAGATFGVETEIGFPPGVTIQAGASMRASQGQERNHSVERSSVRSSVQAFNEAVAQASSYASATEVTREVEGARAAATVTFNALGDVAFSVANIELSLLYEDPEDPSRLLPVATLSPANPDLLVNLGPLVPSRGPFVFTSDEVFPSEVERLMKRPSSVFVRVANFDITDEEGRNLAYVSQEVADRTGWLIIDYGDGRTERYALSLTGEWDPDTGRPLGLRLTEALHAAGLHAWGGAGCRVACGAEGHHEARSPLCPPGQHCVSGYCQPGCEEDVDCGPEAVCVLQTAPGVALDAQPEGFPVRVCRTSCRASAPRCPPGLECSEDVLCQRAGGCDDLPVGNQGEELPEVLNSFATRRITTNDGDALVLTRVRGVQTLWSWDENSSPPTWQAGTLDAARQLWVVVDGSGERPPDGAPFRDSADISDIYFAPGRTYTLAYTRDGDGDGLWEIIELAHGSSDAEPDTDGDELSDWQEVMGMLPLPHSMAEGAQAAASCPLPGEPGFDLANTPAACVWQVFTDRKPGGYRAYPLPGEQDSDGDGLSDRDEATLGRYDLAGQPQDGVWPTDPLKVDTDEDGLSDAEEHQGLCYVLSYGADDTDCDQLQGARWFTHPTASDTDGDGLSDGLERRYGTNPLADDGHQVVDADRDGLPLAVEGTCADAPEAVPGADPPADAEPGGGAAAGAQACQDMRGGWPICLRGDRIPSVQGWRCPQGHADDERRVFSLDHEADSDGDGLCDFVEYVLGTNPSHPDTDGDGLSDRDEWDHRTLLPAIVNDCASFPGCFLPDPEASLRLGTEPWNPDTDGDGLSDGAELDGWRVHLYAPGREGAVVGFAVDSDPLVADSDGDGLSDRQERDYAGGPTHPRNPDTDGDGLLDSLEQLEVDSLGNRRHPLTPDQRFQVHLARIELIHSNDYVWSSYAFGASLETPEGEVRIFEPGGFIDYVRARLQAGVELRGDDSSTSNICCATIPDYVPAAAEGEACLWEYRKLPHGAIGALPALWNTAVVALADGEQAAAAGLVRTQRWCEPFGGHFGGLGGERQASFGYGRGQVLHYRVSEQSVRWSSMPSLLDDFHACPDDRVCGAQFSLVFEIRPLTPDQPAVGDLRLLGADGAPVAAAEVLAGSADGEGSLQIYDDRGWTHVCGSDWTADDSAVACRQLYGDSAVALSSLLEPRFEASLDGFECSGDERLLRSCLTTLTERFCEDDTGVRLTCGRRP